MYRICMEHLLAFIEFTQYQQYLVNELDTTQEIDQIEFPNNIPTSIILQASEDDDVLRDIKIKAHRIYKKYVAVGSEFEINISFDARQQAVEILHDLDSLLNNKTITADGLFKVFKECSQEIWILYIGIGISLLAGLGNMVIPAKYEWQRF